LNENECHIDLFLDKNRCKRIVAVQGLGYVGIPMSVVVANKPEFAVVGIEIDNDRGQRIIKDINNGKLGINSNDPKLSDMYNRALKSHKFIATCDTNYFSLADIVIVDVNLDVHKMADKYGKLLSYSVELEAFREAITVIAERCKPETLIIIETTVPPGTCLKVVKPIFDYCYEDRNISTSALIAYSYERVTPGAKYIDSIINCYRVYSGVDQKSAVAAECFLKSIVNTEIYPLTEMINTTAAELAKVLENSYRAMNISFIQEWTEFAEIAGVDLFEVISAIRMRSTHNNIKRPGLGVGGYCLTKDPLLASWAKTNFFQCDEGLRFSVQAVDTNDQMPNYSFRVFTEITKGIEMISVLILGVSYSPDVGDTRFTPVELFYDRIIEHCHCIDLHDPFLTIWKEKPEVNISNDLKDHFNDSYDIIVLCVGHQVFNSKEYLEFMVKQNCIVFDTNYVLRPESIDYLLNEKVNLRIVGNGTLRV